MFKLVLLLVAIVSPAKPPLYNVIPGGIFNSEAACRAAQTSPENVLIVANIRKGMTKKFKPGNVSVSTDCVPMTGEGV